MVDPSILGDYLLSLGVATRAIEGKEGWAIWVLDEDKVAGQIMARPVDELRAELAFALESLPAHYLEMILLRDFEELLESHGLHGLPYGHFGEGCMHMRIDFDLLTEAGASQYRRFVEEATELVVSLGGSVSGEHGDGRARSELLSRMYGAEGMAAFASVKDLWDPDGRLNPGIIAIRASQRKPGGSVTTCCTARSGFQPPPTKNSASCSRSAATIRRPPSRPDGEG